MKKKREVERRDDDMCECGHARTEHHPSGGWCKTCDSIPDGNPFACLGFLKQ